MCLESLVTGSWCGPGQAAGLRVTLMSWGLAREQVSLQGELREGILEESFSEAHRLREVSRTCVICTDVSEK